MSYRVRFAPAAGKALARIDRPQRLRIQRAVERLAETPRPAKATPMRGWPDLLRLRVGDYRVVYTVRDDRLLVLVVDVGHRREIDRHY